MPGFNALNAAAERAVPDSAGILRAARRGFSLALSDLVPSYMPLIPGDPLYPARDYRYVPLQRAAAVPDGVCDTYHLGALMENASISQLEADIDAVRLGSGLWCDPANDDFNGTNRLINHVPTVSDPFKCGLTAGTAQPGGTEVCYDVKP